MRLTYNPPKETRFEKSISTFGVAVSRTWVSVVVPLAPRLKYRFIITILSNSKILLRSHPVERKLKDCVLCWLIQKIWREKSISEDECEMRP